MRTHTPLYEKPLKGERIVLWPPQEVAAKLLPTGIRPALVNWQPPLINAEAIGGYEIERTTYWPGIAPETQVIGCVAREVLEFEDSAVKPDEVNEYRIRAFHSSLKAIKGPWSYSAAVYGFAYTTYDTLLTELRRFAMEYPEVCRIIDAGPAAQKPYRIWCAVLGSDKRDSPDRPGILLAGNVHAGELDGGEVCLGMIRELLRGWAAGDPTYCDILQRVQLRIVPFYNPAGRSVFEDGYGGKCRKNLPAERASIPLDPLLITGSWPSDAGKGVDPNRSFDVRWQPKEPGAQNDSTYPGEEPWSAPEAVALARIGKELRPLASMHYHGSCGYVIMPGDHSDGSMPVERNLHSSIGEQYAEMSNPSFGAGTGVDVVEGLSGAAHDWFYQEFYGAHFLIEGFAGQVPLDDRQPPVAGMRAIPEVIHTNMRALVWLADRVNREGLELTVTDEGERPVVAQVEIEGWMDSNCKVQKTDPVYGRYRRLLPAGDYTLSLNAPGFTAVRLTDVVITSQELTSIQVRMQPHKENASL